MRRAACVVGSAVVVLLAGCSSESPNTAEPDGPGQAPVDVTIPGVQSFPGLSHEHAAAKQVYQQQPPVGGRHWPPRSGDVLGWQACGVYTEPLVDEFAVHSLEHGAVWLTYRPGASLQDVATLKALAATRPDYVLVSPYPGQRSAFMATAWGVQLKADRSDDVQLAAFTRRYVAGDQGGEPGADCAGGASLAQAQAALSQVR